ncbi:MAG TPA: tetratricopeptide repeat protein [Candidatus Competibacteraceae bacterium]|nr:tetratricopeptide repeat protein [Candidatus Competibacteraceae bacterium]
MKHRCAGLLALLLSTAALAQEPADLDSIRRLAENGDRATALAKLDQAIASNENDIQARFLKGLLLSEQGDTHGAEEVFSDIVRRYPRLPEAYNNLAVLYAGEGEYEKARGALLSAIGNAPDYPGVRANLGDLYVKMAADAYRKALELNPADQASQAKLKVLEQLFGGSGG